MNPSTRETEASLVYRKSQVIVIIILKGQRKREHSIRAGAENKLQEQDPVLNKCQRVAWSKCGTIIGEGGDEHRKIDTLYGKETGSQPVTYKRVENRYPEDL